MKKIKIFCLPSHQTKERTSGVDFARVIQPMAHLNGYKDDEVEFETTLFDIEKSTDWLEVAKNYDIIYFNYIQNPWGFAAMGAMARKHGVKMVMDLDDSLWHIKSDNPASSVYKKGSEALNNFTAICNEVDYVTCTNSYLKNVILNNTYKSPDKVEVFPNYIDLERYSHRSPFKDNHSINLVHYGSTTHFIDLNEEEFNKGIDRIMSEYPEVTLRMIGAFIPKYRKRWGMRYENVYGHQDIYKWIEDKFPQFMDETDILVVPLTDDIYNRSKSQIKFLESASAKKPGVFQRIRQYQEVIDGSNGMLARSEDEWYQAIKKLIDNKEFRKKSGENAYKTVEKDWDIKKHVKDYADFFKSILQ